MRIFKEGSWNKTKEVCPICKTQKKGEVVLVAIYGKQKGYNCQALQIHLNCLELWINLKHKLIFQEIREKEK